MEVRGRGPCVVLAHGFGGSARNFRPQVRALESRWRCAVYDARGHARSQAPDEPRAYTLEALAADMGRVLDRVGARRGVVGGLSLGAATALAFAQTEPARVRALVLASPPPGGGRERALAFAEAIEREGLEAAGARFVWGPESGLDPRGAALVRQGLLEHSPHALAHLLRQTLARLPRTEALAPELAQLEVPVLLVAGGADPASLAAARQLADALPQAELRVIRGAGHVVNLERRDEFDRALLGFLGGLPPDAL